MIVKWMEVPEAHDYPAARAYLSLVLRPSVIDGIIRALDEAPISFYKAKDVLRASELAALPSFNTHVGHDLKKIENGKSLSPILLVRTPGFQKLLIADGYHRVCASYIIDENTNIPCKIVDYD